jgi:hypothetical protein
MNGRNTRKGDGSMHVRVSMPIEQAHELFCELDEWEEEDLGPNERKLKKLLATACRHGTLFEPKQQEQV